MQIIFHGTQALPLMTRVTMTQLRLRVKAQQQVRDIHSITIATCLLWQTCDGILTHACPD